MIAYWGTLLIACGSAIAALIILGCLCNGRTKKKQKNPHIGMRTVTAPLVQRDVERGQRDGGMVIFAGAGAAVATAAVVASVTGGDGGGGGCGGCGAGGCGGCGG